MSVSVEELENFIVTAQPDLETIKRELSAFNIFNVLGIQHREIRHSNFLGWLFDPNESHELEDVFLKGLFKILRKATLFKPKEKKHVDALTPEMYVRLLLTDLSNTMVFRESVHNIDILIVNEKKEFVITIENKINAPYSEHQLSKYYTYVEDRYETYPTKLYLTLTPFNNENHLNYKNGECYANITYEDIVTMLQEHTESIDNSTPTVKESIHQYIAMTKKDVIYSSDEVKLAQEIYKKYKNELDFIMNNKPDFSGHEAVVRDAITTGVLGDFDIIENKNLPDIIRILPKNEVLKNLFRDPNFKSWGGEYLFCLELFVQKNHLWLKWCFGDIQANGAQKEVCQIKKTNMVKAMEGFDCFKKKDLPIDTHEANPEDPNTGICGVNLFYYDTYLKQDKEFLDYLKEKFTKINTQLIEPWTAECIEKLTT
jgi:hypothetical protein